VPTTACLRAQPYHVPPPAAKHAAAADAVHAAVLLRGEVGAGMLTPGEREAGLACSGREGEEGGHCADLDLSVRERN